MSGDEKRRGGLVSVLAVAVICLLGAFLLYRRHNAELDEFRDELASLKVDAKSLSMRHEALIGDRANLRIERNKLRDRVTKLEDRSAESEAALTQTRADLERTRRERDDCQAKKLDLSRRLEDALTELAKKE